MSVGSMLCYLCSNLHLLFDYVSFQSCCFIHAFGVGSDVGGMYSIRCYFLFLGVSIMVKSEFKNYGMYTAEFINTLYTTYEYTSIWFSPFEETYFCVMDIKPSEFNENFLSLTLWYPESDGNAEPKWREVVWTLDKNEHSYPFAFAF